MTIVLGFIALGFILMFPRLAMTLAVITVAFGLFLLIKIAQPDHPVSPPEQHLNFLDEADQQQHPQ